MNLLEKPSHLSASHPGPPSYGVLTPCSRVFRRERVGPGACEQRFLSPEVGPHAEWLPVPLSRCRSMPSSTCSTLFKPCSSKPSTPSPARTSSTSRSCTSLWPGEHPAARPVAPARPRRQPLLPGPCSGLPGQPLANVSLTSSSRGPRQPSNHATPKSLPLTFPGSSSPGAPACCSPGVWLSSLICCYCQICC